jgi:ATP-dependent Clp protease ATP-binding subunit ClpA
VLVFASDEADALGHGFVTCQHLLYALSRETKGIAGAVLDGLGISADALHQILAETSAEHDRTSQGGIDLADETRDALDRAASAAQEWGHRVVDTEHLLHGIFVTNTSADDMLSVLRVDPGEVLKRLHTVQQSAPPVETRDEAAHAYRFTLESAWLLSLAMDTARQRGAARVGSLHLLAALMTLPGPAQEVLTADLSLNVESLLRTLQGVAGSVVARARLPLAEETQRILGYAIGEAWNRGHLAVAPLHVAMGLARAGRHAALDTLAELGVSQSDLLDALEAVMPPPVVR